jgi:NADH-quinone oxidoreductase subunit E
MTQPVVTAKETPRCQGRLTGEPCGAEREVDSQRIREIAKEHRLGRGPVIAILEEIQAEYGYLPERALRLVSEETGRSLADIYGIATFYRAFSLEPKGRHVVCACLGTACHVRGAPAVVEELERQLEVKAGGTTESREFTLETVNCLGACALGPVVVADGRYYPRVPKSKVADLIETVRSGVDGSGAAQLDRQFPVGVSCPHCHKSLSDEALAFEGSPSIRLRAFYAGQSGSLWLSALYGCHRSKSERDIPVRAVVELGCPHCRAELTDSWICPECEAPMACMAVDGGGRVRICRRNGCTSHMLDVA